MLVLSRKVGESIVIGNDIRITVQDVMYRAKCRLAIEAPDDVLILREELVERYEPTDKAIGHAPLGEDQ